MPHVASFPWKVPVEGRRPREGRALSPPLTALPAGARAPTRKCPSPPRESAPACGDSLHQPIQGPGGRSARRILTTHHRRAPAGPVTAHAGRRPLGPAGRGSSKIRNSDKRARRSGDGVGRGQEVPRCVLFYFLLISLIASEAVAFFEGELAEEDALEIR